MQTAGDDDDEVCVCDFGARKRGVVGIGIVIVIAGVGEEVGLEDGGAELVEGG